MPKASELVRRQIQREPIQRLAGRCSICDAHKFARKQRRRNRDAQKSKVRGEIIFERQAISFSVAIA